MSAADVSGYAPVADDPYHRQFAGKFAPRALSVERMPNGAMILRSPTALEPYPRSLGSMLDAWAGKTPDRVFLAERDKAGTGWRTLTFAEALRKARAIGQALLDRGLSQERAVMIIADNGIDHALVMLGALYVGVPVAPVSVAYARAATDFTKLRHVFDLVRPGMLFVDEPGKCAAALKALEFGDTALAIGASAALEGLHADSFETLVDTAPGAAVDAAAEAVAPETVAKVLFTSGSTDLPKGVINTHGMLSSNQQMAAQIWPFLTHRPPVLVDWLPWSHTFGGNHNFNLVLRHGGTLYIDAGKPVPGLFDKSIAALREVSPTAYFNVPRGYSILLDHLEKDTALRDRFFANLEMLFYAAAALPPSSWARLEALSLAARGHKIPMISSWGLTETAPMAAAVHWPIDRAGIVGLPPPGTELKLVPVDGKLEMRVRGPHITPGYWRRPDLTAAAFDEDGFLLTGDAGAFIDSDDPAQGLVFDGRLGENFKLSSGTWVTVGGLRVAIIAAAAPFIDDAVVTGHDRDEIGLLIFPNVAACRSACPGLPAAASSTDLFAAVPVREAIRAAIEGHNAKSGGASSMRVRRALLLAEPPSLDHNEITDKGYINQRAVLKRRADLVERLYAEPPHPDVIEFRTA
jgi:feruloyl-CoA synthase